MNKSDPLDMIHKIRKKMHAEMQGMSIQEQLKYIQKKAANYDNYSRQLKSKKKVLNLPGNISKKKKAS